MKKEFVFAASLTMMASSGVYAQKQTEPDPLIHSIQGKDLYAAYCASCHGMDAKGAGPASAAMKKRPPDLTMLARRNGGVFPSAKVESTITGVTLKGAHGSSEMPVWGPVFRRVERDQDLGLVRVANLVKYLESIQTTRR